MKQDVFNSIIYNIHVKNVMSKESSFNTTIEFERGESPSEAVLRSLAAVTGADQLEIEPPLFESIDPDALDQLIEAARSADICVSFDHSNHRIVLDGTGNLLIEKLQN